jgi:hypothetical protein
MDITTILSTDSCQLEPNFISRIKLAYRLALAIQSTENEEGMWMGLNARKQDVHFALLNESDALVYILARPGDTDLFCGFENCFSECINTMRGLEPDMLKAAGEAVYSDLILLAEAIGAKRRRNQEQPNAPGAILAHARLHINELLSDIERVLGCPLQFPNPFPDEFGVQTRAGLISYRALQAVYQALRVNQLAKKYGGRVLEIGAGLGRTAYFSRHLGLTDYTIVDLPLTGVAQAAFLGSVIPCSEIILTGEANKPQGLGKGVRIISPEQFFSEGREYDVVLNVDSLTEMPKTIAMQYASFARLNANVLLSINHEVNTFTVADLEALAGTLISRHPYWMREGYVEEVFVFD